MRDKFIAQYGSRQDDRRAGRISGLLVVVTAGLMLHDRTTSSQVVREYNYLLRLASIT
jgi:hypothetical protein